MTTYTYQWANPEKAILIRTGSDGSSISINPVPNNYLYQDFLESGATAEPFVAPPEPEPLTPEQKLASVGLTVDELRTLLSL
jgi:hypothetical protein